MLVVASCQYTMKDRFFRVFSRPFKDALAVLLMAGALAFCVAVLGPWPVHAAIPTTVGYQGRLKNTAGTAQTGTFSFTFRIYGSLTGGSALWSEVQSIAVSDGFVVASLGSVTSFPASLDFNQPLFFTVEVASDGEMSPRIPVNTVPYAYTAGGINALGTTPASATGGRMYYDATNGNLNYYNQVAGAWQTLSSASGTSFTSLTWTNATGTNANITNLTFTDATGTSVTSTNLFATNGTITNGTITNATTTNFFATNATILNLTVTGGAPSSFTNLIWTNATGTNTTSTNLAVLTSARLPTNTQINSTMVCLADGTNCPSSTSANFQTVTNSGNTTTNAIQFNGGTSTGDFLVQGTLLVNSSTALQALTFTNATGTSVTTTNLFSTGLTFTNLRGTNATTGAFAITSLLNCDTLDTDVNGNLLCGSDASGGSSSGAFSTPITVTDGATTSTLRANSFFVATSTANPLGLFNVNSSGNVSASGTLRIFGGATSTSFAVTNLTGCDTIDTDTNGNFVCGTDGGGSGAALQGAYDSGNTITTTLARDIAFTLANSSNFTITIAPTSTGTMSITRPDGVDTSWPEQLLLLQSLDTTDGVNNGILVNVATGGLIETALNVSDSEINTALDVGANVITGTNYSMLGTTASLTWTDISISNDGKMVFSSDNSGDQIFITVPANNFQALVVDATTNNSTQVDGMIDLNVATLTDTAIGGLALDFTVRDAASNLTVYGNKNNVVVDTDSGQAHTVYGDYVGVTANDADSTTYGQAIIAEDAGAQIMSAGLFIENRQATDIDLTDGILVRATTNGSMPDAIDVSDSDITNAINVGDNIILGTTSTIDFTDFDLSSDGLIVIAPDDGGTGITITPSATLTVGLDFNSSNITTDIQFQNDATLDNDTNGDLDFVENSRTLKFDFDAVASRIQVTSTSELEFASSADGPSAVTIHSTNGGIQIKATGASAGEDIRIDATGSSVVVSSTEAVVDAIRIIAANTTGGIDIDSGTGGITIDTTGSMSLDSLTSSNITVTGSGQNLALEALGGGTQSLFINSSGTAAGAIRMTASAGGITIQATGASAGEDIRIDATGSSVVVSSTEAVVDAIRIIAANTTGGIDIDSGTGGMTLDTTGGISLDAAATSNFTVTGSGQHLLLESIGGGTQTVFINSSGTAANAIQMVASAGGIDIFANGASAGEDIDILATGSSVNVQSTEAVIDAITLFANAEGGSVAIRGGDSAAAIPSEGGNDIYVGAEDDVIVDALDDVRFTMDDDLSVLLSATGNVIIDASSTDSNVTGATTGIVQLGIDAAPGSGLHNNGLFIDYEVTDDANANQTFIAQNITLTPTEDAAGDTIYGLFIDNASTAGTAADALLRLNNSDADTAVGVAILIDSIGSGGFTKGIDINDSDVVTDIELQNGAQIDNNTSGTILLTVANVQTSEDLFVGNSTGSDSLNFNEESINPDCAIGDFRIWANSGDGLLKKCQNGALSDLDAAGAWSALTDPTGSLDMGHQDFATAMTWNTSSTSRAFNAWSLALTNDGTTDTSTQRVLVVQNDDDGVATGHTEYLLYLNNADTDESVDSAIVVTSSGGGFTFGLDMNTSFIGTDIRFQNEATLSNDTNGDLVLVENGRTLTLDFDEVGSRIKFESASELEFETSATGTSAIVFEPSDASGGITIDGATVDRTGNLVFIDHDVNSASSSALSIDSNVGTALSSAEVMTSLRIDFAGLSGDNAASTLNGILMTGSTSSGGLVVGLNFAGAYDRTINFQAVTSTLVLPSGGDIVFATSTSPTSSNIFAIKDRGGAAIINLRAKTSTGNPASCDVGDVYVNDTDNTAMVCTSANTWEQMDNPQFAASSTNVTAAHTADVELLNTSITPSFEGNDMWIVGNVELEGTGGTLGARHAILKIARGGTTCADGTQIGDLRTIIWNTTDAYDTTGVISVVDTSATGTTATIYRFCLNHAVDSGPTAPTITRGPQSMQVNEITNLGADLAEVYYTNESGIVAGDVLTGDSLQGTGVRKSKAPYERNLLGVVSTQPSQLMSDGVTRGKPVIVALAGRVPVNVSVENGPIQPGDYLTSAGEPGVAMRATKAGPIIGQALTAFSGEGPATVLAFVSTGYYGGASAFTLWDGLTLDEEFSTDTDTDISRRILDTLVARQSLSTQSVNDLSEMMTDRLSAGVELIAPRVVTNSLSAETLFSASSSGLTVLVPETGAFRLRSSSTSTSDLVTFDGRGNAVFSGEITARAFRADQISGFGEFTAQLTAVASSSAAVSSTVADILNRLTQTASSTAALAVRLDAVDSRLTQLEQAKPLTFQDFATSTSLTVDGLTTLSGGLIVDWIGSQGSVVDFLSDLVFIGRPYFNADSGGFATISEGARSVNVTFDREYLDQPIVSATITLEDATSSGSTADTTVGAEAIFVQNVQSVVTRKTTKGFTILIDKPATNNIRFSWIALAVKDAKAFLSEPMDAPAPAVGPDPISQPVPEPVPVVETAPTGGSAPSSTEPTPVIDEAPPAEETVPTSDPAPTPPTAETPLLATEPDPEPDPDPAPEPAPDPAPAEPLPPPADPTPDPDPVPAPPAA